MSNQFFHTIWVVLATTLSASAQTDTVFNSVRQESGALEAQRIETPQEQAFGTYVPSRWAFKASLGPALNQNAFTNDGVSLSLESRPLLLGVEHKITPAWSVGAYYGVLLGEQPGDAGSEEKRIRTGMTLLETRWYYNQKRRIRAGKSANNFSANYVSLEGWAANEDYSGDGTLLDRYQWSARWGLQRRWMKHGFFDLSFGIGGALSRDGSYTYGRTWTSDQRFSIGLAQFLPRKQRAQALDACSVLRCFDEQRKMLKINAYNVLDFTLTDYYGVFNFQPTVSYEQKLGRSPWSVEGTVGGGINYFDGKVAYIPVTSWLATTYNAAGELRWYYNQRRRILTGRGGNNLSGPFVALQAQYTGVVPGASFVKGNPNYLQLTFAKSTSAARLVWGIQQRAFKHGYIQFKVGAGLSNGYNYAQIQGGSLVKTRRGVELDLLGQLQVGFAF